MQKRFVSWAAVSSLPQAKKVSLEDQLKTNQDHIERWEGQLVEELVVPGESRNIVLYEDAAKAMPAYARLRELIEARAFEVFVYLDRSRLGRKAALSMALIGLCHEAGIITYSTESPPQTLEPPERNFHDQVVGAIESVIAQEEVVKIQRRHEMGMAARVKSGNFPARIPYGWTVDYIKENDKPVQIVQVDEDAKAIISYIIDLYVDEGLSFKSIAKRLHDEGVPTPREKRWKTITIDRIIGMVWRYAGYVELNRRSKKRPYIKAKSRWPALISEERAKQVVAARARRAYARRSVESPHLFSQIVWCDKCRRPLQARYQWREVWRGNGERERTENYRCMTEGEPSHPKNQIAAFYIVDAVEKAILHVQNEENRQRIWEGYTDHRPHIEQSIAKATQRLAKHEEAVQRADDAYVLGKMDYDRYNRQLENLARDRAKIEAELAAYHEQLEDQAREEGRADRLIEIANEGLRMLHSDDIAAANVWFQRHMRIWIDNDNPERRIWIEYL